MIRESFIYIIGPTENPVKVGRAENVYKRLRELQVGCPDQLVLHDFVMVPAEMADGIERAIHYELRHHHRRGEWFNIAASEARDLVEQEVEKIVSLVYGGRWSGFGSDVQRLITAGRLSPWTGQALAHYRRYKRMKRGADDALIEEAIFKAGGIASQAIFESVIIKGQTLGRLFARSPRRTQMAEDALVVALNAMANWYAKMREDILLYAMAA